MTEDRKSPLGDTKVRARMQAIVGTAQEGGNWRDAATKLQMDPGTLRQWASQNSHLFKETALEALYIDSPKTREKKALNLLRSRERTQTVQESVAELSEEPVSEPEPPTEVPVPATPTAFAEQFIDLVLGLRLREASLREENAGLKGQLQDKERQRQEALNEAIRLQEELTEVKAAVEQMQKEGASFGTRITRLFGGS